MCSWDGLIAASNEVSSTYHQKIAQEYPLVESSQIPPIHQVEGFAENARLCGVNSLYLVLNALGEESTDYQQILAAFPKAAEEGTSLNQLKEYLLGKGFSCRIEQLSEQQMARLSSKIAVIALLEKNNVAHLLVKLPQGNNTLKLIDPPYQTMLSMSSELHGEREVSLMVSRDHDALKSPFFSHLLTLKHGLFFAIILLLLTMIFLRFLRHH